MGVVFSHATLRLSISSLRVRKHSKMTNSTDVFVSLMEKSIFPPLCKMGVGRWNGTKTASRRQWKWRRRGKKKNRAKIEKSKSICQMELTLFADVQNKTEDGGQKTAIFLVAMLGRIFRFSAKQSSRSYCVSWVEATTTTTTHLTPKFLSVTSTDPSIGRWWSSSFSFESIRVRLGRLTSQGFSPSCCRIRHCCQVHSSSRVDRLVTPILGKTSSIPRNTLCVNEKDF